MQERISTPVITAPGQGRPWVEGPVMIQTQENVLNEDERAALYAQYVIDARMAQEKEMLRAIAKQSAQEQAAFRNAVGMQETNYRIPA